MVKLKTINLDADLKPIDRIIDLIKNETNLNFNHFKKEYLISKLHERMDEIQLSSLRQYLIHIINNREEIHYFINSFRIQQSKFFKNKELLKKLEKIVKTKITNTKKRINAWIYPGCSGEEAYTFAIFLKNVKKTYNDLIEFKIYSSVFFNNAFEIALDGVYKEETLVNTPLEIKEEYFKVISGKKSGKKYIVDENIKKKVIFLNEEILQEHSQPIKYDLIVCRNFISTITQEARKKLLKLFERNSKIGTLLVVGEGENLQGLPSRFESIKFASQIYKMTSVEKVEEPPKPIVALKNEPKKKKKIASIRKDRVLVPLKDVLFVKSSHYAIVHSYQEPSKMVIYGLGSCIALILRDRKNDVHGMSHIMLPDSQTSKDDEYLTLPHKYIDTSIKELQKELISHGARKEDIKAIIIGGAHIINVDHMIKNSEVVIEELEKNNIPIEKIDLGGKRGRSVIYDAKDGSILVKKARTDVFTKL
ncbi:MAG: CheR family methyltransferase [Promethearchaeota archaeon]